MKLFINGVESQVDNKLDIQFAFLEDVLRKEKTTPFEWLEGFCGNYRRAKSHLKKMSFNKLATSNGIIFLKSKSPCPMGN